MPIEGSGNSGVDFVEGLHAGKVLAGKYRVERVLGQGGMGVVVLAEHLQLGQRVALKFLLPSACANEEAVARFLREARAAVQVQSEHVARVSDVGKLDSGSPYMVMEFLRGSDLAEVLRDRGPLSIAVAVDYVLQACVAVAEAHSLGIVHRDLKPSNLFLTKRPEGTPLVKVLDFGISKVVQSDAGAVTAGLTSSASVLGSPQYMSPEQVRSSRDLDVRTDIWSLGVILYELLVGTPPYNAETPSAIMAMIVADEPVPVRAKRSEVPVALEAIILRCLEKTPSRRYQNVAALAAALGPFASKNARPLVERIAMLLGHANAERSHDETVHARIGIDQMAASIRTLVGWGTTSGGTRRRPIAPVLTVAVAVLAGIVGIVVSRSGRTRSPETGVSSFDAYSGTVTTQVSSSATAAVAPTPELSAGAVSSAHATRPSGEGRYRTIDDLPLVTEPPVKPTPERLPFEARPIASTQGRNPPPPALSAIATAKASASGPASAERPPLPRNPYRKDLFNDPN